MMEKRLIKRTLRYHRTLHNRHLEALICLYKDCIYIKVDTVYDDKSPRVTLYETFLTFEVHYDELVEDLEFNNTSKKLAIKIKEVLEQWRKQKDFTFDEVGIISINGGNSNGKQ